MKKAIIKNDRVEKERAEESSSTYKVYKSIVRVTEIRSEKGHIDELFPRKWLFLATGRNLRNGVPLKLPTE